MRIVFIGSVYFSLKMLEQLIEMNADIVGVCTRKNLSINSDHSDLSSYCELNKIPWIYSDDVNSPNTLSWIRDLRPDIILCFGWSQLLKENLLKIPEFGVIGFHPSQLPINRGKHPIIWALVLGLEETGSTFFKMDLGIDNGEIISQKNIRISTDDNASTLYEKIIRVAQVQLIDLLANIKQGKLILRKQHNSPSNYWRKRTIADGLIDWRMAAISIHNLVRGLSSPYPGAHFLYKGLAIKVWKTEISPVSATNIEPGKILEVTDRCTIVKCGIGAICLIDTDPHFTPTSGEYL